MYSFVMTTKIGIVQPNVLTYFGVINMENQSLTHEEEEDFFLDFMFKAIQDAQKNYMYRGKPLPTGLREGLKQLIKNHIEIVDGTYDGTW